MPLARRSDFNPRRGFVVSEQQGIGIFLLSLFSA